MALSRYCRLTYTVAGSPLIVTPGTSTSVAPFLVLVEAAQVQPAADGVQTHRVVGRVVARQPGNDAPDGFRRLIADLDGAGKLAHIVGDVAPVGVVPSICLVTNVQRRLSRLEIAAFVLRGLAARRASTGRP